MSAAGRGTTATPAWRVIAGREMTVRLRDKTFIGSTLFLLAAVALAIVLSAIFGGRPDTYEVAVVDPLGEQVAAAAEQQLQAQSGEDDRVETTAYDSADAAEQAVSDEEVEAALLPTGAGFEVVGNSEVDAGLASALAEGVSRVVITANAAEQGVDMEALNSGAVLEERLLDGDVPDAGASAVAFAFAIVFLFTAISFGMSIAQSVVQEKESRVVEILAASVPVRQMLWGKIVGNTVLALAQIVLLVVVGAALLAATGRSELLSGVGPAMIAYVLLFVLGFLALASLWSVAGSLATSQEELQSTTLPGQVLLFVPYFAAVSGSDGVREVMSMLPIVSTMVMPGRLAEGDVPLWQVAVAVVATVVAAVVLLRVGARLYERTLLQTSRKIGYREALRMPAD